MVVSSVFVIILDFMSNTTTTTHYKSNKICMNFINYIDLINVCLLLLLVYKEDENEF